MQKLVTFLVNMGVSSLVCLVDLLQLPKVSLENFFLEVTTLPVGKVPSHVEGEETKEYVERVSQQLPGQKLTTHNVFVFNV